MSEDTHNCTLCGTQEVLAPGIDYYCPNPVCHEPITPLPKPQRWITWVEPWLSEGIAQHCAVTAEDIIKVMRKLHPKYLAKNISDEQVLDDFVTINLASTVYGPVPFGPLRTPEKNPAN
jgi:hypothetical protein